MSDSPDAEMDDSPGADWTEDYPWTLYRGPQPWPCPAGWVLRIVEGDGTGWNLYPGLGEGLEKDTDVSDCFDFSEDDEAEAYNDARDAEAWLVNDLVEFDRRDPSVETHTWKLRIDGEMVFECYDPGDFDDVLEATAEALTRYASGQDWRSVEPSSCSMTPAEKRERELERRKEENRSIGDYETDGGGGS